MAPGRIRDGVGLTNALGAGAPAAVPDAAAPQSLTVGGVAFHEITDDDVEQVVALWEACGLARPWNDPRLDVADVRTAPSSTILVARTGAPGAPGAPGREAGAVVATAMAGFDGHRGWIYYVAVAPDLQGTGLGRDAVVAAEAWLAAQGVRKVRLMVRSTNTQVLGFYERLGYADTECTVLGRDLV
ncbi:MULTISPECIES: GNAT family acetyltransferase [Oerskovia]|uniref:GNAT family acetyltransferase n=2 Tax=Oerskovia TaxID=162491 RepID=A0ABR8V4Q9_9CELL|nr:MULTISPECIES: GNAT family acetyltransferase [Oerskovia]MBD7999783.1 GNAT family acetyltransferase [Oerskovia gallyi]MBM7496529.1 ribosomal protein S18 acetylase RimI-like enzyme [Oerskovia paurometabola]